MWRLGLSLLIIICASVTQAEVRQSPGDCHGDLNLRQALDNYVEAWDNPLADVPVMPEDLPALADRQIRALEIAQCISDYSFQSRGRYVTVVESLADYFRANSRMDHRLQAVFSLLIQLNQRWESEMLLRRSLEREEEDGFKLLLTAGAGLAVLSGRVSVKAFSKLGRLFRHLSGRPTGVRFANSLLKLGAKPGVYRSSVISVDGSLEGSGELKKYKSEVDSASVTQASQFVSVTGDVASESWHSPYYFLDQAVNHGANELTSYESYELFRDFNSLILGSAIGIATPMMVTRHFKGRTLPGRIGLLAKSPIVGRIPKVGWAGVEFAGLFALGYAAYEVGTLGVQKISDIAWQLRVRDRMLDLERSLRLQKQDYWVEHLDSGDLSWGPLYEVTVSRWNSKYNYPAKVSGGLLDLSNRYMYAVQQNAEFSRGTVDSEFKDLLIDFVDEYLCEGVKFKKHALNLQDHLNGHNFPTTQLLLSRSRSEELFVAGDTALSAVELKYKNRISEFAVKHARSDGLQTSLDLYDAGIETLRRVQADSGRYFINGIREQMKAAKNRSIYRMSSGELFSDARVAADVALYTVLQSVDDRNDFTCMKGVVSDYMERFGLNPVYENK